MKNEENLYFTEMTRLVGVKIEGNSYMGVQHEYDNSSIDGKMPQFDYHLELTGRLLKGLPDPEEDDHKIIIRYLGNGEFEEITSHEKMTLATYMRDDEIWNKLGVSDDKYKHLDNKTYDTQDVIKEEVKYFRQNPIRIWAEDGLDAIKPISQLSDEEYHKYSDEFRISKISEAKEKALYELKTSISEIVKNEYSGDVFEEDERSFGTR